MRTSSYGSMGQGPVSSGGDGRTMGVEDEDGADHAAATVTAATVLMVL
jgi:hypothetical protein